MMALRFRKSVLTLVVTSLLAASARAESLPPAPTSPPPVNPEQPGRPAPPSAPAPAARQIFANAKGDTPTGDPSEFESDEYLNTPVGRKAYGKTLLITGGIFSGIGLALLTTGIIVANGVSSGDHDPLGAIFSIFGKVAGGTSLVIGPILLGAGGYKYTTPLQYE